MNVRVATGDLCSRKARKMASDVMECNERLDGLRLPIRNQTIGCKNRYINGNTKQAQKGKNPKREKARPTRNGFPNEWSKTIMHSSRREEWKGPEAENKRGGNRQRNIQKGGGTKRNIQKDREYGRINSDREKLKSRESGSKG